MDNVEFFKAAGNNDIASLARILDTGEDPNIIAESGGHTPLYNACFADSKEAVHLLLQRGADPNKIFDYHSFIDGRVERGLTVIMIAQSVEVAKLLIDSGANVNIRTPHGTTPLMRAAFRGHPEVVSVLLDAGASPSELNESGRSAMDIVNERIEFFRQHSSIFKDGHAKKRIQQFENIHQILQRILQP